jgi:hypothetical protein
MRNKATAEAVSLAPNLSQIESRGLKHFGHRRARTVPFSTFILADRVEVAESSVVGDLDARLTDCSPVIRRPKPSTVPEICREGGKPGRFLAHPTLLCFKTVCLYAGKSGAP